MEKQNSRNKISSVSKGRHSRSLKQQGAFLNASNSIEDIDNYFVDLEKERRLKMWNEINLISQERFLKSEDVRRIGFYGSARGVWRDASKNTGLYLIPVMEFVWGF